MVHENNAAYWRAKAEECVQLAPALSNPDARKEMLEMAESYDRLAKLAEARGD